MQKYQKALYDLRTDKDLKQEDVPTILKVSKQAYAQYEKKKRALPIHHLKTLCKFYHVSADYILGLPEGLHYPKR